jgi:hypothetical protein
VTSPAVTGYTASSSSVIGVMDSTSGKSASVNYTINSYTLTVYYDYDNNTTAAPTATQTKTYARAKCSQ